MVSGLGDEGARTVSELEGEEGVVNDRARGAWGKERLST